MNEWGFLIFVYLFNFHLVHAKKYVMCIRKKRSMEPLLSTATTIPISPPKTKRVYNVSLFNSKKRALTYYNSQHQVNRDILPSSYFIPVPFQAYDQGSIGSCVSNSICATFKLQESLPLSVEPSRLFHYYAVRSFEHAIGEEGAYISDGFTILDSSHTGVCSETKWPYITSRENTRPPSVCFTEAKLNHLTTWAGVATGTSFVNDLKQVLVSGKAVVIGIAVYESFESDTANSTGMIPMPDTKTESLLGGHAIAVVGYDDAKSAFLLLNSWGTTWGTTHPANVSDPSNKGYCYLPYAYVSNDSLCDEGSYLNGVVLLPPPPPPLPPRPRPRPHPRRRRPIRRRLQRLRRRRN